MEGPEGETSQLRSQAVGDPCNFDDSILASIPQPCSPSHSTFSEYSLIDDKASRANLRTSKGMRDYTRSLFLIWRLATAILMGAPNITSCCGCTIPGLTKAAQLVIPNWVKIRHRRTEDYVAVLVTLIPQLPLSALCSLARFLRNLSPINRRWLHYSPQESP